MLYKHPFGWTSFLYKLVICLKTNTGTERSWTVSFLSENVNWTYEIGELKIENEEHAIQSFSVYTFIYCLVDLRKYKGIIVRDPLFFYTWNSCSIWNRECHLIELILINVLRYFHWIKWQTPIMSDRSKVKNRSL